MVDRRPPGGQRNSSLPRRQREQGGSTVRLTLCLLLLSCLGPGLAPGSVRAQEAQLPDDTFRDEATRALVLRAQAARLRDIEGIDSYEGLMREHIYVGIRALSFRRERGLFEQERIARLRWESDGERAIHWLGARRAVPIIGADTRLDEILGEGQVAEAGNEVSREFREELPNELLRDSEILEFAFDPGGDRLAMGGDWALNPLADTAVASYRYALGDTLRLSLPDGRQVVLLEVQVEPRTVDFHLVAASLWFDQESASLVRATYKPGRPFDLAMDEPDDAEDVPAIFRPVVAEISYITVEYGFYEFQYWLPRRFGMEGEARLGRLMSIPLSVEWDVRDYEVNRAESLIPATGPLPPGWSRREQRVETDEGEVSYVTIVVPEAVELLASPELSESFGGRAPTAFTDAEIAELRDELDALLPEYRVFRPRFAWGLQQGLTRYNRVEGLSVGAAATVPVGATTDVEALVRFGSSDQELSGTLALAHGPAERRWTLSGYHRLNNAADYGDPFSLKASVSHLATGGDRGVFYRSTGAGVAYDRVGRRTRARVEGFVERHRSVQPTTDFFLLGIGSDKTVAGNIVADAVDLAGGRVELDWFRGHDPNGLILAGRISGEAAGGDMQYQRAFTKLSASHPIPFGLAAAVEVGAGTTWGDVPIQREFYLGGTATMRGVDDNQIVGNSFWLGRVEIGTGFAGARLAAFADWSWAGPRADFGLDNHFAAAGVGVSLLDGLMRADVARAYRGDSRWKLHLYLDGLF